ncbi:hypothetical protein EON65_55490 [archaeon]|nr:MAG: hypothetical protein EON65_55490 [archaeon]
MSTKYSMDLHKKRIAELQALREQIAKSKTIPATPTHEPSALTPHLYSNNSSHVRQATSQPDQKGHDGSIKGKARIEARKTNSVHHTALSLLTEPSTKSPPNSPSKQPHAHFHKQPEPDKPESTFESSRKDPIHRKLQSTVKLLSEALEEVGQLKALLELTMDKHLYNHVIHNWDSLSDKFMRDVKIRALEIEKENLLYQVQTEKLYMLRIDLNSLIW